MHYDFHARQYDPHLGLFTSPDPLSGDYPALSSYLYCAGNPVMFTDPTGMIITDELLQALMPLFDYANMCHIFGALLGVDRNLETQLLVMFNALNASDQEYDFRYDHTLPANKASTKFYKDKTSNKNLIVMYFPYSESPASMCLIGHELMHMYQFETGRMSFPSDESNQLYRCEGDPYSGFIYDQTDEFEAYYFQYLLGDGYRSFESIANDDDYKGYSPTSVTIESKSGIKADWLNTLESKYIERCEKQLRELSKLYHVVFRHGGKTFINDDADNTKNIENTKNK